MSIASEADPTFCLNYKSDVLESGCGTQLGSGTTEASLSSILILCYECPCVWLRGAAVFKSLNGPYEPRGRQVQSLREEEYKGPSSQSGMDATTRGEIVAEGDGQSSSVGGETSPLATVKTTTTPQH